MPLTDGGPEQVASPSKRANLQNRIGMNFPICRSCARISIEDGAHFKGRIEIDPAKSARFRRVGLTLGEVQLVGLVFGAIHLKPHLRVAGKFMLRILGLFDPFLREVVEMARECKPRSEKPG